MKKLLFNKIILSLTTLLESPSRFTISQSILMILAILFLLKKELKVEEYLQPHFYILYLTKRFLIFDKLKHLECFFSCTLILKSISQKH